MTDRQCKIIGSSTVPTPNQKQKVNFVRCVFEKTAFEFKSMNSDIALFARFVCSRTKKRGCCGRD